MKGVSIIETESVLLLRSDIKMLKNLFNDTVSKLKEDAEQWMDAEETAKYMKKSASWIYKNKALLGFSKPGADILFNKKKVDAYLWSVFYQTGQK